MGLGASVAAFLAFGLTPLASAPAAHADIDFLGDIIDPLFGIDPTAGADSSVGWDSFWGDLGLGDTTAGAAGSAAADPLEGFYTSIHGFVEDYMQSPAGETIDGFINTFYAGDACGFICNGVDGTAADPDGGDGGVFIGDGGDGFDSTSGGTDGGATGDAGFFGNGGNGGDGKVGGNGGDGANSGDGGKGGAGGAGTDGAGANGNGGDGGAGGDKRGRR
jgi:hypothetical protein